MKLNLLCRFLVLALLFPSVVFAQTIIKGKVTDSSNKEALASATVQMTGSVLGVLTDENGNFELITSKTPPFRLSFSFIGYAVQTVEVTSVDQVVNVALEYGMQFDEVVISASRKAEKIQDAPASVSVISAKTMQAASSAIDPVRELMNVPGVQIQQHSAARMNIEMRGASALFDTQVFPIMDYRSLVGPGIGTFQSDASGLNSIDLERIEVVRGPASALYGPGVNTGVVHFITKSPIDYPGTTVELIGGTLNTFGGSVRHAMSSKNKKFGFKVNAHYKKGDEFTLDGSEGTTNAAGVFTSQSSKFQRSVRDPLLTEAGIVAPVQTSAPILLTQEQLDPDGDGNMMQDFWMNNAVNGTLEYRPMSDTKIIVSAGHNNSSSVFYNSQGEGLFQANEIWTQARFQKRGFFAQFFFVDNDGGKPDNPTFLYQTGNRSPIARRQFEGQLQYNFVVPKFLNADFTVGSDYRLAQNFTEGKVFGRNEDNDDYLIFGAYAQGKFELTRKIDFVVAGRADRFNFIDAQAFSPRVAFVYKAVPNHTFRASFNISNSAPSGLNTFIDFPVASPVPGLFDVWLKGQVDEQRFGANPTIDFTAPGLPNLPYGTPGLPLAVAYGALTPNILPALQAGLPASLFPIVQAILTNPANAPAGTTGQFTGYNLFTGAPMAPVDTKQAQLRTEQSFEIGYKGMINKKLGVTVDLYHISSSGFSNFTAISPTIRFSGETLAADLSKTVGATVTSQLQAALIAAGQSEAVAIATASQIGGIVGGAYGQGGAALINQLRPLFGIFGAVENDQSPDDGMVHNMAGYRIFGSAQYWGTDIGLNYAVNNDLTIFGNYSMVSQNVFNAEELGEDPNSGLEYSLNVPKNKFRLGATYAPVSGFRGNVSYQHDDSFLANFGQFSGMTDVKNMIDAGVGYKLTNGLSVDLTCTNLFNQQYRTFVNMPIIQRRAIAKVTYTF
jgi:iron complex outermembrane receptor protein